MTFITYSIANIKWLAAVCALIKVFLYDFANQVHPLNRAHTQKKLCLFWPTNQPTYQLPVKTAVEKTVQNSSDKKIKNKAHILINFGLLITNISMDLNLTVISIKNNG